MLMPRALDVVRFGEFELDVRAYALRRNGHPVRLERRPMDLLIFLVERHGELVTRTDIFDQLWGKDVFIEVEPAVNTAIKKIRRALNDSPDAPTFVETVPGKGYRFVAAVTNLNGAPSAETPPVVLPEAVRANHRRWVWFAAAVSVAVIAMTWWWSGRQAVDAGPMQVVALTTLTGNERGPTFSPDARQVAFTWNGEAQDNWDVYVKLIGSPEVRRLTMDPRRDLAPRWSFDGRLIAYLRQEPSGEVEHLRVMSALGGSDRQVSELNVLPAHSWSPDDRWIAAGVPMQAATGAGVYLLPVNGGTPRRLTQPSPGGADWMTAFSPDGRQLAYGACTDFTNNCHVQVLTLDAAFGAVGQPRRLTAEPVPTIRGLTWARDGLSVIYGVIQGASNGLWRVEVGGAAPPQRIEIAGANALFPAIATSSDRLAFSRELVDEDVYAFEVGSPPHPVARSSVFDGNAQFSPDSKRIAFCSGRTTDATELWIADADGGHAEQLTYGPGQFQCSPAWSPDGQSLAFESRAASGESHIHVIDLDARQLKQLTSGRGDRGVPSWSRNGQWVYFSWDAGTGRDIWRVQRNGGSPEQVTNTGSGFAAVESADAATLFYLGPRPPRIHEPTDAPLFALPLTGGPSKEVIACVRGTAFSVSREGINYLPCRSAPSDTRPPAVLFLDVATGKQRSLGALDGYENKMPSGFSASFDGRTFLYNKLVSRGEDLLLIENFR